MHRDPFDAEEANRRFDLSIVFVGRGRDGNAVNGGREERSLSQ